MKIIAKNAKGVESTFTEAQWANVQKDARYIGVFSIVRRIDTPKEIDNAKTQKNAAYEVNSDKADKTKLQDKTK